MEQDQPLMREALKEARRGAGLTSPNPTVGALIAKDNRILSQGWHHGAGLPHAEREALQSLAHPDLARGATLYVTLEPCSTQGRTPPCTEAILKAGLARVVIGTLDPNPRHAGRGVEILRQAGVEVEVIGGAMEEECRRLNLAFNHWIVTGMPWVIAKAGMSLDGRITRPGPERWITNALSRADSHQLRARVDAILVGGQTVRDDNPRLTVRGVPGMTRQPWRVVVSRSGKLPEQATIFTDAHRERTLVFAGQSLKEVLEELGRREVTSVLIEGGMRMLGMALEERLIHEVCLYIAPLIPGGPKLAFGGKGTFPFPLLLNPHYTRLGDDLRLSGEVDYVSNPA